MNPAFVCGGLPALAFYIRIGVALLPLPALTPLLTFMPFATVWLWLWQPMSSPALTFVLTFSPRATVWLWLWLQPGSFSPALTPLLTFKPLVTVWLWLF